eukprot:1345511-Prymnesium_polylepis.1
MPRRVSDGAHDRQRDDVADAPRAAEGQPDVLQGLRAPITRRNSARDCSPVGPSECSPLLSLPLRASPVRSMPCVQTP